MNTKLKVRMVITVNSELEAVLRKRASEVGVSPEELVSRVLRERLLPGHEDSIPQDEWEHRLAQAASDCGVSLSDEALGRDELYD